MQTNNVNSSAFQNIQINNFILQEANSKSSLRYQFQSVPMTKKTDPKSDENANQIIKNEKDGLINKALCSPTFPQVLIIMMNQNP